MEETERGFQQTKYYKTTKQRQTPDNSTKNSKQNVIKLLNNGETQVILRKVVFKQNWVK